MTAKQSGYLDLNHCSFSLFTFYRALALDAQAAGAAYCRDPLFLGIHINHGSCADERFVQRLGSVQPYFFLCRKYTLYRRMLDIFIIQHHEHQGNRHTVVRSERSAVCGEHRIFYNQVDSVFFKIMLHSGFLFADHVDMSLQHNRRLVFRAFASAFFYDYIIRLVLMNPESSVLCELYKIIADSFFISRSSRNRADFFKKVK